MSTYSRVFVGLTLDLHHNNKLLHEDFKKLHELEAKYPEVAEESYDSNDFEGKLLLIYDGMSGKFARLIFVEKVVRGASFMPGNYDMVELASKSNYNPEVITKMFNLYEEYTGNRPKAEDFKYAMWGQWY